MEQNQAIIILTGGTVPDGKGGFRSTTYEDGDAFGVLGGCARVEAGATLSQKFPDSYIVTTSQRAGDPTSPSHAAIMKEELVDLGVNPERIILEETSTNTKSGIEESLKIAEARGWRSLIFVTSDYHVPRVKLMTEMLTPQQKIEFVSAEEILIKENRLFKKEFEKIQKSPSYQKRVESEKCGIEALKSGSYKEAVLEDKKERLV